MRFLVLSEVDFGGGWDIVSVCMDCFKAGHQHWPIDSATKLERFNTTCAGCGEPIQTVRSPRKGAWDCCSNRCYQRLYRKRRRGVGSVIDWKAESSKPKCAACSQQFNPSRSDARFCSSRCRQWQYRRRRQTMIGGAQ
jgi:predicted nucleic acid-binding Zn ribbon protein